MWGYFFHKIKIFQKKKVLTNLWIWTHIFVLERQLQPEALKSLYRSPGNKKNQLVLCKNYVLQW
jgi:hypothetical protein